MKNNILLSFTTLNGTQRNTCFYYNRMLVGLKQPSNQFMEAGKATHEKFSKLKKLPFDLDFPSSEVHFKKPYKNGYILHGFADRANYKSKSLLELKSVSKKLWSNYDMDKSFQPVYYSFVSSFRKVFLLTTKFDLSEAKLFYREYTDADWKRVEKWTDEIINKIETVDWKTLTCDASCPYGQECRIYAKS